MEALMSKVHILLLVTLLGFGWDTQPAASPAALWEELQRLPAGEIWPGFRVSEYPLAVFDGRDTCLFAHPRPPAGFTAMAGHPRAWRYAGRHPAVMANTTVELGDVPTATVILTRGPGPSDREWAAVALHEMFHAFAWKRFPHWGVNEMAAIGYPKFRSDNLAGVALERMALAEALRARDRAMTISWVKTFLGLRRSRFATLPPESGDFESRNELNEGMARYAELKALGREGDPGSLTPTPRADGVRRWGYDSGCAQGALLDQLLAGWKDELGSRPRASLADLLDEATAASPVAAAVIPPPRRAEAAARAEAAVAAMRRELATLLAPFADPASWRIIIETEAGGDALQTISFDPMNMAQVGPQQVVHTRMVRITAGSGKIELLKAGAPENGVKVLFECVAEQRNRVVIAGFPAEPLLQAEGDQVRLSGGTVNMAFSGAKLKRQGREIRITLRRP